MQNLGKRRKPPQIKLWQSMDVGLENLEGGGGGGGTARGK